MRVIINKQVLEQYIREVLDSDEYPAPHNSQLPAVVNEPPMAQDSVIISPATDKQVMEPNMPIDDDEWVPGNNDELRKAVSQLVAIVPEGHRQWFWKRLKNLVSKTEIVGGEPGTGDMEYESSKDLPVDKQRQRPNTTWRERQGLD